MEEKEVRTAPEQEEQKTGLDPAEPEQVDSLSENDEQEEEAPAEEKRLYMGRFTAGVWRGGILGLASGYILLGILGLLNDKLSLGIREVLDNPAFKYGLMIVLMFGLGKLGGYLEKLKEEDGDSVGE